MDGIVSLQELPARHSVVAESRELGQEVRLLLVGRRNRTYKVYFAINYETLSTGLVRVFHVRHWARNRPNEDELQDLIDDLEDEETVQ